MEKRKINDRQKFVLTIHGETSPYSSGRKGAGNYKCGLVNSKHDIMNKIFINVHISNMKNPGKNALLSIDGYKAVIVFVFAAGIYTAVELVDKLCGASVVINADNHKIERLLLLINQKALNRLGKGSHKLLLL